MALLSDYDRFDKEAYQAVCVDILKEVMRTAKHNAVRGYWEIPCTDREKISYAIEGAQVLRHEAKTERSRNNYYAIEAALKSKLART